MSTRRAAPRGRGKAYRGGRNARELCECPTCKRDAIPGQSGCWISQWLAAKHRREEVLRNAALRQSAAVSQHVSGNVRAEDDERETRGELEGSSKRVRLTQSDDEFDHISPPSDHIEHHVPSPSYQVERTPPADHIHAFDLIEQVAPLPDASSDTPGPEHDNLRDLYEDPEDADELMMDLLSHVEELAQDSDDSDNLQRARQDVLIPDTVLVGSNNLEALSESTFALPLSAAPRPPDEILADSHDLWFVRVVLLLVAYLNTKFHLTFKACALILFTIRHIFVALGIIKANDIMPETLQTTFKHLELQDRFHLLVTCPACFRMFEPTIPSTSTCSACETLLFHAPRTSAASNLFQKITKRAPPVPKPKLCVPFQPLSGLLTDMLAREGMEEEIDAWKSRSREDGKYNEIMDGAIWNTLKGHDKKLFFNAEDDSEELRIGVTLGLDWFSCARSAYASSHSSGVFSFCVSNLPPALRYRPKNLLLSMMTPGPSEPTGEELQRFNALLVDDLIQLYENGILIPTPLHPEGESFCRLVRVALLGIVCDHPAMCKMCGFADKSHNEAPCTKCHATSDNMFDDEYMTGDHHLRDGSEHKARAAEWKSLNSPAERTKYFKAHGVRWTEFARLSYFDIVRMTIVDPMHNLLLGVVRTQWYSQWIQTGALRATTEAGTERELAMIHKFLDSLEAPGWIGRLPMRVGEPAGGSLSADEYKTLITMSGAMMLPIVIDMALPAAKADCTKAQKKWKKAQANPPPPTATGNSSKSKSKPDIPTTPPMPRICKDEIHLTLLLATALKILLGSSLDEKSLQRGESLLLEYLKLYKKIYGVAAMKPNFHFATHTVPQIRDYGPVPGFWCFLGERLNKLLKGVNLNNQRGGQLEITMMRSFGREVQLQNLVMYVSQHPEDPVSCAIAARMLADGAEPRGTVESLAHDPDVAEDALSERVLPITLGPKARAPQIVPDRVRAALYNFYNAGGKCVYYNTERRRSLHAPFLNPCAQYYTHVLVDGRRVTPVTESKEHAATSSVVKVSHGDKLFAGEVLSVFLHHQAGILDCSTPWAEMRWMQREMVTPVQGDPWEEFPELEFECWTLDKFHDDHTLGIPPAVIPITSIRCQLARMTDHTAEPSIWLTTSLDRHAITMGDSTY